jgi:probable HAF family extracellular repeat protein
MIRSALIGLLLALGMETGVRGQCMYEYVPLPQVQAGGSFGTLSNQGIGEDDTVVGFLNTPLKVPGVWMLGNESLTFLTLPEGFAEGSALGIFNAGSAVGHVSFPNNGMRHPVFWRDGVPELLPRDHPEFEAIPNAINRHLHIVGEAGGPGPVGEPPFFRPAIWIDGEYSEILNYPFGPSAEAFDINDRGEIVGWMGGNLFNRRAFHWVDGVVTDLGLFPNVVSSTAVSINNLGLIVGWGFDNVLQSTRPLYWRHGTAIPLTVPNDTIGATAFDVNDGGQIVGDIQLSNLEIQATLWQRGQRYNLNDFVINAPRLPIEIARAINNRGVISVVAGVLVPIDSPRADIDTNCRVDVQDLLLVLREWDNDVSIADVTSDGIVDVWDLLEVITHWGQTSAKGGVE